MIRGLLITAVVSFVIAVVCLTVSSHLGFDWRRPGWGPFHDDAEIAANGPDVVRAYAWSGGEALTINAPAEVVYTQGPASKVTVTGPQALLDRVTVEDGEISLNGRVNGRNGLKITVEAPMVSTFRFNGGQDIEIRNYAQDRLSLEVNGAAEVDAQGSARVIDVRANGASDIDLDDVVNDEAKVELNGASSVSVAPRSAVDIRINGVGNVSLGSKPARIKKEIHGVGSVSYETGDKTNRTGPPPAAHSTPRAEAGSI